jgi:DNA repair protein RecN (Recombination protein N)
MLRSLTIQDFVLVDNLTLHFEAGFNVLTGETGAGKSILIDAVGLLLGDRADSEQVKKGALQATISAQFDITHLPSVCHWLQREKFKTDKQLELTRQIDVRGRSHNFINQQSATLSQLKTVGEYLVDIHGQQSHHSLVRSETQRALLDAYAGASFLVDEVAVAWREWQEVIRKKQFAEEKAYLAKTSSEALKQQIEEVMDLALKPGEWDQLNDMHDRLANANLLITEVQQAIFLLSDGQDNCLNWINQIQHVLGKAALMDKRLLETKALLESAKVEMQEVLHNLRQYANTLKEDPEALLATESRIDRALKLSRKYRVEPQALDSQLAIWQDELAKMNEALDIERLIQDEELARNYYYQLATELTKKRQIVAKVLEEKIVQQMKKLAMPSANFAIYLTPLPAASPHGLEAVDYWVSMNAGVDLRLLAKVASGGELSRISLAMQVAMSEISKIPTLIFDEVDNGVGGGVAETIGQLLKNLGLHHQIFAITHLPQVAVYGDQHWCVSKAPCQDMMRVTAINLGQYERVEEVARMLGGLQITAVTKQHAKEMLLSIAS